MSDTITIGRDRPEEEMLTYEVSDEALERAAGDESERAGKYSIAWCTFLTGCPIWARLLLAPCPLADFGETASRRSSFLRC
jgi:hypothetical protein